jgi:hypothetical protein
MGMPLRWVPYSSSYSFSRGNPRNLLSGKGLGAWVDSRPPPPQNQNCFHGPGADRWKRSRRRAIQRPRTGPPNKVPSRRTPRVAGPALRTEAAVSEPARRMPRPSGPKRPERGNRPHPPCGRKRTNALTRPNRLRFPAQEPVQAPLPPNGPARSPRRPAQAPVLAPLPHNGPTRSPQRPAIRLRITHHASRRRKSPPRPTSRSHPPRKMPGPGASGGKSSKPWAVAVWDRSSSAVTRPSTGS